MRGNLCDQELIFCIFPTLFIILMGPAAMGIMAAFS